MTNWRSAELARSYSAGSETPPEPAEPDWPTEPDRRTPQQQRADEDASRRMWGLPPLGEDIAHNHANRSAA